MQKWEDISFYRDGEQGVVNPTDWVLRLGDLNVHVHRIPEYSEWFLSCVRLNIQSHSLGSVSLGVAKKRAINKVYKLVVAMSEQLQPHVKSRR